MYYRRCGYKDMPMIAAKIKKYYKKVWGRNGKAPENKKNYILVRVTKERGLNGWYLINRNYRKVEKL